MLEPSTLSTEVCPAPDTNQSFSDREDQAYLLKLCKAKWPDMPLVFATEYIDAYAEESNDRRACLFKIATRKSREELCAFYKQEMERAGWQSYATGVFSSYDLFIYDKPYKTALVKIVVQEDNKAYVECLVLLKDIFKLPESY